jgi:hypothetical protein
VNKVPEVEAAKALMLEAMTWSVIKWLREKKRVRRTADRANAALDDLNQAVKAGWPEDVKSTYQELSGRASAGHAPGKPRKPQPVKSEMMLIAKKVKEADDDAYRARMDAEKTFDEAERQLSTALAREGCRKAIHSWELHETAIGKAEAVIRRN